MSYRRRALLRRLLLAAPPATVALLAFAGPALAASGTGLSPLLPNAVSENGQRLYVLYNLISIPALVVFVLIEALLLIIIVRDRRSRLGPGYRPPQWHGNTRLEITWTVIPTLILVFIGSLSFVELQRDFVRPADAATDVDITVEAHQFGWRFIYPEGFTVTSDPPTPTPMVIPTGKLVRLRLQSRDVIHSFWVPDLTGKTDAVPGYDNYTWIKVAQTGEWRGQCTELCGAGHDTMLLRVRAVSPDEYAAWVADQVARSRPSPSASPSRAPRPGASASPGPSLPSPGPSPS